REGGEGSFEGDELLLPKLNIHTNITYRSAFFHHRFRGPARRGGEALEVPALAGLLADALDPGAPPTALLERVRESLDAVTLVLEARERDVDRLWSATPLGFEETEQALLLGHPLHP